MISSQAVDELQVIPESLTIKRCSQFRFDLRPTLANPVYILVRKKQVMGRDFTGYRKALFLRFSDQNDFLFAGDMTDMDRSLIKSC